MGFLSLTVGGVDSTVAPMKKAKIVGTGMALPDCVVDNHLLARCFATSDEWITQRTGIKERRVVPSTYRYLLRLADAPDKTAFIRDVYEHGLDGRIDAEQTPADLGREAAEMALKSAGLQIEDIDFIIVSTTTPDMLFPSTACLVQDKIGATHAWGFDLFDGQLPTPHLASLGLRAWPRERFLRALAVSVARPTRRGRWKLDAEVVRERLAAGTQGAGAPGIG